MPEQAYPLPVFHFSVDLGGVEAAFTEVSGLKGKALRGWQGDCAMIFQQFNLVPRLDVLTVAGGDESDMLNRSAEVPGTGSAQDRGLRLESRRWCVPCPALSSPCS